MDDDQVVTSFTEEHKQIRRALDVLRIMTDRVANGIPTDPHDVNALLIFLHYFGDVLHQAKEESILFPALRSSKELDAHPELKNLIGEHHEDRGLIEKAQFMLFTDNQDEFIASARKVILLISEHAHEEELSVLPLVDSILTRQKADEMMAKVQEADARFGFRQRELLMDMLQHLEEEYFRLAA